MTHSNTAPRTRGVKRPRGVIALLGTAVTALALTFYGITLAQASSNDATPDAAVPMQATGSPEGWGAENGGTTGGGNADVVDVSSSSELLDAINSDGPLNVRVNGSISIDGMNDVASDKTIFGADSGAAITGGGLDISGVSNVIVQNLNFSGWGDDAINVQESSTNIWIDHNSFSNGSDGAVDIKRESDFITVSWNHFFDHDKTMLLGHSDDHTADIGHLRVSYHHNWFDGTNQRHPRVRFGNPVHVYNNFYDNVGSYGVATTMDAGVLVEGNYFLNTEDPTHVGEGSSDPGNLVFENNVLDNSGDPQTAGSVASIPYSYDLDDPNSIPDLVSGGAGAGNL